MAPEKPRYKVETTDLKPQPKVMTIGLIAEDHTFDNVIPDFQGRLMRLKETVDAIEKTPVNMREAATIQAISMIKDETEEFCKVLKGTSMTRVEHGAESRLMHDLKEVSSELLGKLGLTDQEFDIYRRVAQKEDDDCAPCFF